MNDAIIDVIVPIISAIISSILGYVLGSKKREANTALTKSESEKVLAQAIETYANMDSEELNQLGKVIQAWKDLFNATNMQLLQVQKQQLKSDIAMTAVIAELEEYKNGVVILIEQLENLGIEPNWQPIAMENEKEN